MRILSLVFFAFIFFAAAPQMAYAQEEVAATAEATPATPEPLEITRITPEGEHVPASQQVVITFNRAVVPIGRMERTNDEVPVVIEPALNCEWRWLNNTSLSCRLKEGEAMKLSTAYKLTVKPGITAEDGATIAAPYEHTFTTRRADVEHSWFQTWRSPGTPVVRLTFNQPVTIKSVQRALSFVTEGGKTVKIKLEVPKEGHPVIKKHGEEYHRVLIGEPVKELPLDSSVALKLSAGLRSSEGDEPSAAARDVTVFDTFPALAVKGLRCYGNEDQEIKIAPGTQPTAKCNPLGPIALEFSVPVKRGQVKQHVTFAPALGSAAAADDVWGDLSEEYSRLGRAHSKGNTYDVFLPQGLKAEQTYTLTLSEPKRGFWARIAAWFRGLFGGTVAATALEDEFGRTMPAGFTLTLETDPRRPDFEIIHNTAVLESQADSEVPLYVTNLEKTAFNFRSLTSDGVKADATHEITLPEVRNLQYAVPFDVRAMLGGKTGAVYGYLGSTPEVPNKSPYERKLFAQVTPWQVHAKIGHFSSIVWVTDMATGAPVEGAKVTFYRDILSMMSAPAKDTTLAVATTDANGVAKLAGTEEI